MNHVVTSDIVILSHQLVLRLARLYTENKQFSEVMSLLKVLHHADMLLFPYHLLYAAI